MNSLRMYIILGLILAFLLPGCKQASGPNVSSAATSYLTVQDDSGRTVSIPAKPQRIVVLSPTYLELLYAVGGSAVGRSSTRVGNIPAAALNLPEVGFAYNVNVEQLLSLKPDLVIGVQGVSEKLVPVLETSKVPILLLRLKTIEDLQAKTNLLGDITGNKEKAAALVNQFSNNILSIKNKLPAQGPKAAILRATAKSVTLELPNSLAGSVAKELNITNVAAGSKPLEGDPDAAPYSLEKLVEADPDIVLVTVMGDAPEIERRMRKDIAENPAWASVRAVREGRVYFLPSNLFQVHPGLKYDQAMAYLAKIAYPEVFGHDK